MTSDLPLLLRASVDDLDVSVPVDLVRRSRRGGQRRRLRRRLAVLATGSMALAAGTLALFDKPSTTPRAVIATAVTPSTVASDVVNVDGVQIALPEGYVGVMPDGSALPVHPPVYTVQGARVSSVRLAPEEMSRREVAAGAPGLIIVRVTRSAATPVVLDKPLEIAVRGVYEVTGKGVILHHRLSPDVVVEVLGIETTEQAVRRVAERAIDSGHDDGTPARTPGPN